VHSLSCSHDRYVVDVVVCVSNYPHVSHSVAVVLLSRPLLIVRKSILVSTVRGIGLLLPTSLPRLKVGCDMGGDPYGANSPIFREA